MELLNKFIDGVSSSNILNYKIYCHSVADDAISNKSLMEFEQFVLIPCDDDGELKINRLHGATIKMTIIDDVNEFNLTATQLITDNIAKLYRIAPDEALNLVEIFDCKISKNINMFNCKPFVVLSRYENLTISGNFTRGQQYQIRYKYYNILLHKPDTKPILKFIFEKN